MNVILTEPEPIADGKVSVTVSTPLLVIVLPGGDIAVKAEIFNVSYVIVTSVTVDVLGLATKLNVVVTSNDDAWLGVVNAKVASTPKAKKRNRFFIRPSFKEATPSECTRSPNGRDRAASESKGAKPPPREHAPQGPHISSLTTTIPATIASRCRTERGTFPSHQPGTRERNTGVKDLQFI
jgi:hypothetical protein